MRVATRRFVVWALLAASVVVLPNTVAAASAPVVYTGSTANGAWTVSVPSNFNGTLVVYSHGYRFAPGGAEPAPSADVAADLLAAGFAIAGSSYPAGGAGWQVPQGVAADTELIGIAKTKIGATRVARVYAWGDSLGGLVTQSLAEARPDLLSGVAPMCGVLGGTNLNLDLALDAAVATKTFFYPQLKLTGFSSLTDANNNYTAAQNAILGKLSNPSTQAGAVGRVIGIALLLGAPLRTATSDGAQGPTKAAAAATESLLTALKYGTAGRYDIERRVGGNASTNVGVNYLHRVTPSATSQFASLGFSSGLLTSYAQTMQTYGARVTANTLARSRANALGNPTGKLSDKTITMHTEFDPLVIVQNENVFKARVSAQARTADLLQLFIKPPGTYSTAPFGAGHCNFSRAQYVAVLTSLDTWVRTNVRPSSAQLTTTFAADSGLDLAFAAPAWPAH